MKHTSYDAIIIGGGAAGLFCGSVASARGRRVLVVEQAKRVGRKILMSGGGRCNFTNMYSSPDNFLSANPHFCKSALSQYTQWHFIELVDRYKVAYHEKTLGQLFCDESAKHIVNLLMAECDQHGTEVVTKTSVDSIEPAGHGYRLTINGKQVDCQSLVIATGGLSIPSMGPHGFGYQVAKQFDLPIKSLSAALVPFVMPERWLNKYQDLAGSSLEITASNEHASFQEGMLFTHKGLSGPSVLQISSYWHPGEAVSLDLSPTQDVHQELNTLRSEQPKSRLKTYLSHRFTKRVAQLMCDDWFEDMPLADLSNSRIEAIASRLHQWAVYPQTTEGYKTAEVTLGGLDTQVLSSKTMMVKDIPGLFFIGEVVDVTGHLGGHNFQWAWSSAWVAGQHV